MTNKSPESYLAETEHAARYLLAGIDYYENLLAGLPLPSQANDMDEVKHYIERAKLYFGYYTSEATLCGAILQIAFMGIFQFSRITTLPPDSYSLVRTKDEKAIPFYVGRLVHDIPIGLIIYAGRNQFNHWDDPSFDYPTTKVFLALRQAYYNNPIFDMTYELEYPARTIRATHLVLNELNWITYEQYSLDMKCMLCT